MKSYNAADAWRVNFPQIWMKGCPCGLGIGGDDFLYAFYSKHSALCIKLHRPPICVMLSIEPHGF